MNLSEATLLDNVLRRYMAGEPYTYTGGILTSVNPCRATELYSAATMTSYAGRLLGGGHTPHLYAMAEEAVRARSARNARPADTARRQPADGRR